ncbi:endoribonuclease L-PSP [Streptomyces albus]|uniref:Endoribonuclease L-PSP n=1 Tax=Streptomyces albus (strain ATCC 21838 / DSM 41398 / FERM P-419 / JCM 4703 / NBRC 107858) TaxID=1081613 RepID=A0A0B5EET3_STRA4|nr:endoribonuclease L-PSP [Streptomyces albus]AOU74773.1 endoribonuclease L-PSP [Streptomyces albus]AYN30584.1 RidA family protein [Streptomyces albus]
MTSIERLEHDPDWYEPYRISLATRANGLVFVSGQAGIDEQGRTVGAGDFEAQARRAFQNVATVLEQGGGGLSDVVKVTIMVTDMSHLDQIVRLREEFFTEPYPADTLLQVAGLARPDWMIEIEAIALAR